MSSSGTYTTTQSKTFTVTHARHIVVKIATDLKRMQRYYRELSGGKPSDHDIENYQREAIALMLRDYMDKVEYGFKDRSNQWRIALKYEARSGGILIADDMPGEIYPRADIRGCEFTSFLVTNHRWSYLSEYDREMVYTNAGVSFRRTNGEEPRGNWAYDKTYSAGGRGIIRSSLFR